MAEHLNQILNLRMTRRGVVSGGVSLAASTALGCSPITKAPDLVSNVETSTPPTSGFEEVRQGYDGGVHWPQDTHVCDLVVSWGDPILPGAPSWERGRTTATAQTQQFGDANDFLAFLPLPKGSKNSDHGLLVANHEFTSPRTMFVGHEGPLSADQIRTEMVGHGMSVVEVKRTDVGWGVVTDSTYNRRITLHTPFDFTGPAAGSERLRTAGDTEGKRVLGTMANCAGGVTPWGTVLSGEENVQVYWSGDPKSGTTEQQQRSFGSMGIGESVLYKFADVDSRFDLKENPNEPNRFGWVVEVDPYDPTSTPKKHTALGRFFHEGAEVLVDPVTQRVVVYMGDDTADECLYRFVSAGKFDPNEAESNGRLLEDGTLAVAEFSPDGMRWNPLKPAVGGGAAALSDVLIDTRLAALAAGGTPMDRPERIAIHPQSGDVYVMLTKNPAREQAMPANARSHNLWGQILVLHTGVDGHLGSEMKWSILLEGGPTSEASVAPAPANTTEDGQLSCPDNCTFDKEGRLWVTTDGNPGTRRKMGLGPQADGLYVVQTQGPHKGHSRMFFRACVGAELTGPCFTPDNSTLFLSVQHPGRGREGDPPTCWPAGLDDGVPPRSSVVALRNKHGGPVI